jgi:hypothetical protein
MVRRYASFFPQRVNLRVPAMEYANGIDGDDVVVAEYGAPAAANNTALLVAQSIATAGGTAVLAGTYTGSETQMARWGRGIRAVASAASTSVLTITGRDYLGQRMIEQITLSGATPVLGVKAFRYVDRIDWTATAGVSVDVGLTNVLGVPWRFRALVNEIKNGAPSANAGTFVAGLAANLTPSATNADTRGTYLPVVVVPDGVNTFEVRYIADNSNLHGARQFA